VIEYLPCKALGSFPAPEKILKYQFVCYPWQSVSNYTERYPCCIYLENLLKNFFLLLLVVLNVRYVKRYMIASGKLWDRNQVLAVFPLSFVNEFLI
jgi:hypothetical protein